MTAPRRNCLDFLRLSEPEHCAAINAAVSASTNLFLAAPAKAEVDFFKGEAAGTEKENAPGILHAAAAHDGVTRKKGR